MARTSKRTEVTKTRTNGTIATFSALLRRLARMLSKPLTISFWINSASKVRITMSVSEPAAAIVTVVVVTVVTMDDFSLLQLISVIKPAGNILTGVGTVTLCWGSSPAASQATHVATHHVHA